MIHGRDWASYQGTSPDTSGLDFVFIKATQGLSYINPDLAQQSERAAHADLVVGFYHYPDMRNGAGAEAQHFVSVVQGMERTVPHPMLCLDWEGYDPTNQGVSHADQAAYKDAFLEHLAVLAPHNRHVLYCNLDYWRNIDTSGRFGDALWIATDGRPAGAPGIATPWTFHQYAVTGGLDQDVANFSSRGALATWANPQEADMPLTDADAQLVANKLLATTLPSPFRKDAAGHPEQIPVSSYLEWMDKHYDDVMGMLASVKAEDEEIKQQLAALQVPGGVTAAQLEAAAEAGAAAAIQKVLESLTIKPAAATV